MALNVKLYVFTGHPDDVTKSSHLTQENDVTGVLFQDVEDVMHPYVEIDKAAAISPGTGKATFWTANYCYIQALHRYYFIESQEIIDNDHYVLRLRVDTLLTYRSDIRGTKFFVERSQSAGVWYIPDPRIQLLPYVNVADRRVDFQPFSPLTAPSDITYCCILHAAGGSGADQMTEAADKNILYNTSNSGRFYAMRFMELRALMNALSGSTFDEWFAGDAKSGVFSLHALPFDLSSMVDATSQKLWVGKEEISSVNVGILKAIYKTSTSSAIDLSTSTYPIPDDYRIGSGDFLIRIYLPAVGWQTIDPVKAHDMNYLFIRYKTNVLTGNGTCSLYLSPTASVSPLSNAFLLDQYEYNVAVSVPLSATNAMEKDRAMISTIMSSALSVTGAVISHNPAMIGMSVAGAATSIATQAMSPLSYRQISTMSGGNTMDVQPEKVMIQYVKRRSQILDDTNQKNDFAARFGKMYQQSATLSSLSGRTVVTRFEMDLPEGCTTAEYNDIKAKLAEGVNL